MAVKLFFLGLALTAIAAGYFLHRGLKRWRRHRDIRRRLRKIQGKTRLDQGAPSHGAA